MFYFPSKKEQTLFELNCLPLPKRLMQFLIGRGLNVIILPDCEVESRRICYDLLQIKEEPFSLIDRLPHENAHYDVVRKSVIIPALSLDHSTHNIVLHELGHALDYLYYHGRKLVSDHPQVKKALCKVPPLDNHCLTQDEFSGTNREQFASSFEAYFNETAFIDDGVKKISSMFHTISDIDLSFVQIVHRNFILPFYK